MKNLRVIALALILAIAVAPLAALASDISGAKFYGTILISNNSTATTNVSTVCAINTTVLIDGDYLNSAANNTVVRNSSGADVTFMPGCDPNPWCVWVPAIGEDSYLNYILYTAESTGGKIRYFPGIGGMTSTDNASLELGNNFTIEQKGWIDTSQVGGVKEKFDTGDDLSPSIWGSNWWATSFTTSSAYRVGSVELKLHKTGNPGTVTVGIRATAADHTPTGSDLSIGTYNGSSLGGSPGVFVEIPLSPSSWLASGTEYAIVVRALEGDISNLVSWRYDNANGYSGGMVSSSTDNASSWSPNSSYDSLFRVLAPDMNQVNKPEAFSTWISGTGNITSAINAVTANITPTGFVDPDTAWSNETNAYDDNTTSYAETTAPIGDSTWSSFIELTRSALWVSGVRYYAGENLVGKITQIDIDLYDGSWHDMFEGAITKNAWKAENSSTVYYATKMRMRFYAGGGAGQARLMEAQFQQAPIVTATGVSSGEHTVTTRQTVNLLSNGDFEVGDPPTGWTASNCVVAQDGTTKRINSYSANITTPSATHAHIRQTISDWSTYVDKTVTLGAWCLAPSTNVENQMLNIYSGISPAGDTDSSVVPKDDKWHWITVTQTLPSNATCLWARAFVSRSTFNATDILYVDDAFLIEGSDFSSFEGNMLSNWSFENGDPPNDWSLIVGGGAISQSSSQVKNGTYSMLVTRVTSDSVAQQTVNETFSTGEKATMGCWVYATVANRARLEISSAAMSEYSSYHSGSGTWEWLTVTRTHHASGTIMYPRCNVQNGDTSAYFDGAILVSGNITILDTTKRIDHLQILVDGTWHDSSGNCTVPDNSNNWTFISNSSMPYMEYHKISINGTLQQHIEWENDSSTFTDLSGNSHDATPTFRTSSSDADVSAELVSFLPVAEAKAPAYVLGQPPDFFSDISGNVTGNFTVVPPAGTFPLAGVITAVANATSTPPQLPLLIIAAFVILTASLAASYAMRTHGGGSVLVKSIVIAALMGVFVAIQNFGIDFWMVVVFAILATALCMGSKQIGWS